MLSKENKEKVIKLCDDDSDAMMLVLRHLYGLESHVVETEDQHYLETQARVYAVADKYQVETLLVEVCKKLSDCLLPHQRGDTINIPDFLAASRIIFLGTPSDSSRGREIVVRTCVNLQRQLRNRPDVISLLSEAGALGAAIINHEQLSEMVDGMWICSSTCCGGLALCSLCRIEFREEVARDNREAVEWSCPSRGTERAPKCGGCGDYIMWRDRKERW